MRRDYAETLVRLPRSYQINDRGPAHRRRQRRAESLGLPAGAVVLCCFNATYKINPEVMDAWSRILAAVPGSVLWLLARNDDDTRDRATARARRRSAASIRRACSSRRCGRNAEYLALYRHADLFLDTWPYNAHTTGSDALWAGCPLVTFRGETFAGRVAASLLAAVGLPELVARDVDGYVELAIALARDEPRRRQLRAHLDGPGRASALFDTAATTAALEAAYLKMAEQYRSRRRRPFRVEPRT